jgi:hypothetical protein
LSSAFTKVFNELTGETFGHSVKKFTPEQLAQQPTILFQLSGDESLNQAVVDRSATGSVVGLAGDLDPDHPLDILLAIPPEHYYEFDPDVDGYVARFYVDEGSGGVLGANTMMGHDVYFDIGGFHVGWAESTCDYTTLVTDYSDGDWVPAVPPPDDPSRIEPADEPHTAPVANDDTVDATDDNTFVDETDPSGNNGYVQTPGVCSGFACQLGVLAGVVLSVVYVAIRLVRRAPSGPAYDLADSELELQTASDGDFVNRRNGEYS